MGHAMKRFSILLGGDIVATPRLAAQIADTSVIAADSGIRHAASLGVVPELWLGDFDSVTEEDIANNAAIPRKVYERDKDFTDGELAIQTARDAGAKELILVGAFGGPRADHAYQHMAQALKLAKDGVPTLLTSGDQEGRPLALERQTFDYADKTMFSILAFSDLSGLTVEGAKWPLDHVEVGFGATLTLSNEVAGTLSIELGRGTALLIAHLDWKN